MKRTRVILVLFAAGAGLSGCYREVVSAKGLGAAAYQRDVGKGGNYSGLPFDDAQPDGRPRYTAPNTSLGSPRPPQPQ